MLLWTYSREARFNYLKNVCAVFLGSLPKVAYKIKHVKNIKHQKRNIFSFWVVALMGKQDAGLGRNLVWGSKA